MYTNDEYKRVLHEAINMLSEPVLAQTAIDTLNQENGLDKFAKAYFFSNIR